MKCRIQEDMGVFRDCQKRGVQGGLAATVEKEHKKKMELFASFVPEDIRDSLYQDPAFQALCNQC